MTLFHLTTPFTLTETLLTLALSLWVAFPLRKFDLIGTLGIVETMARMIVIVGCVTLMVLTGTRLVVVSTWLASTFMLSAGWPADAVNFLDVYTVFVMLLIMFASYLSLSAHGLVRRALVRCIAAELQEKRHARNQ